MTSRHALAASLLFFITTPAVAADGKTLRVPADRPTIQAAIDAAAPGDTVSVDPGTYREKLKLGAKPITLASRFHDSREPADVERTILDLADPAKPTQRQPGSLISITPGDGPGPRIIGFTIRNAGHAVLVTGRAEILHCRFLNNGDALSFEDGHGVARFNLFEGNGDDGIDMDGGSEATIEDNEFRDNKDDGIEIRLHKYAGPPLEIVIRRNRLTGNKEDGVQLIDYPGKTPRTIRIERNVFANNAMAAIGSMEDGDTKENYAGAELREPVFILNNTFVSNKYGVTGGNNMILLNNVFADTARAALRKVNGDSAAGVNLFWRNGADQEECDLNPEKFIAADPLLGPDYKPGAKSRCLDGGVATFKYNGETLTLPAESYAGPAPDLGAAEASAKR
jgi:hypothetical protein